MRQVVARLADAQIEVASDRMSREMLVAMRRTRLKPALVSALVLVCLLSVAQSGCSLFESKEGCFIGESYYGHGTEFPSPDGCNGLSCEDGKRSTTLAGCVACEDFDSEQSCETSGADCQWLEACGDSPAVCRSTAVCEDDGDCLFARGTQGTCNDRTLGSCDETGNVCEPPACWKARTDVDGNCLGPSGLELEAACCDLEARCIATGGQWDLDSCGHYVCGEEIDCSASTPGCDCRGSRSTYVEGMGCVIDSNC